MSILFFHGDQQLTLSSGDVSSCVSVDVPLPVVFIVRSDRE